MYKVIEELYDTMSVDKKLALIRRPENAEMIRQGLVAMTGLDVADPRQSTDDELLAIARYVYGRGDRLRMTEQPRAEDPTALPALDRKEPDPTALPGQRRRSDLIITHSSPGQPFRVIDPAFSAKVENAVLAWWRQQRPHGWTEAEHIANPTIFCRGAARDLGIVAAELAQRMSAQQEGF